MDYAHYFGLVGESANFIGALFLAYDLFSRPALERNKQLLESFNRIVRTEISVIVPSAEEPIAVGVGKKPVLQLERYHLVSVSRYTKIGLLLLAVGFVLLITYHCLELFGQAGLE